MSTRILFLPADDAGDALLLELDDGGRMRSRAALRPGATAPAAPGATRTVLVVPGRPVRIEQLDLPAHSEAQARAAARALVAGRLARPAALHVALDPARTAPVRTVASVEDAVLRAWLARAEAFGLRPDAALPEPLLLPEPPDAGVHVLDAGDRWLVRGDGLAFSATPDLAERVLGGRTRVPVTDAIEHLAACALQPALDLLQGDFAPASAQARPRGQRLAWLAAALLASPLLLVAARRCASNWPRARLSRARRRPWTPPCPGARAMRRDWTSASAPRARRAGSRRRAAPCSPPSTRAPARTWSTSSTPAATACARACSIATRPTWRRCAAPSPPTAGTWWRAAARR